MGSVGAPELLIIFLVALLVLGPDRLPKAARQVGKAISEFKRVSSGFQDEVKKALDVDALTGTGNSAPAQPGGNVSGVTPPPADAPFAGTPTSPGTTGSTPDVDLPPPPDDPSRN